jgi:hypothetical protein
MLVVGCRIFNYSVQYRISNVRFFKIEDFGFRFEDLGLGCKMNEDVRCTGGFRMKDTGCRIYD